MRRFAIAVWLCFTFGTPAPVLAQWAVIDVANLAQNAISATQAVSAEVARATQYALQLQQYSTQMQNLARLGNPGAIAHDFTQELSNANTYTGTLRSLYGDLNGLQNTVQQQFQEQAMSGLTWDQYVQREAVLAQRQQASSQFAFGSVQSAMQRVDSDYAQMLNAQAAIHDPANAGAQSQMEIMNQQLTQLVSMTREMLTGIAAMVQSVAQNAAAEAARSTSQQGDIDTVNATQTQATQDTKNAINTLRSLRAVSQ